MGRRYCRDPGRFPVAACDDPSCLVEHADVQHILRRSVNRTEFRQPPSTSPMMTENSTLRATNSPVPSNGSTYQTRDFRPASSETGHSSEMMPSSGNSRASPSTMMSCARRAASVTGSSGPLYLTSNRHAYTSRIALPALRARSKTTRSSSLEAGRII